MTGRAHITVRLELELHSGPEDATMEELLSAATSTLGAVRIFAARAGRMEHADYRVAHRGVEIQSIGMYR